MREEPEVTAVRLSQQFRPPKGWRVIKPWGDGFCLVQERGGLRAIIDWSVKADGNCWLHLSVSRKGWTPSHADMALAKQDLIGDCYAYAVFPPQNQYVNIHVHCLHLWALMDGSQGKALPEFSGEIAGVKTI